MKIKPTTKLVALYGLVGLSFAHAQTVPASQAPTGEAIQLEVFRVQATDDTGYKVSTSTSATRFATPLKDIPQSVNIITADFLQDTNSFGVSDAVRYVSNVSRRSTTHQPNTLVIRGFNVGEVFQDGFQVADANRDFANVSRIEIIKGPASATIGRGAVGGAVNIVTKQPLSERRASIDAVYGSFDFKRLVIDSTGPVNDSRTFRYRAIGVWQDNDGWRDPERYRKQILYPSVAWDITSNTQLNVSAVALKTEAPSTSYGTWITSNTPGNPPGLPEGPTGRDLEASEPWDNRNDQEFSVLVSLNHKFNEVLQFRQGVHLSNHKSYFQRGQGSPRISIEPGTGDLIMSRNMISEDLDSDNVRAQGDLVARYEFLGARHTSLIGYEWGKSWSRRINMTGNLVPINLSRPVLGAFPTNVRLSSDVDRKNKSIGIPIHHQTSLFDDKLKLTLGVRYDKLASTTRYNNVVRPDLVTPYGDYTASPRYGITFELAKWATIYAVRTRDTQQPTISPRYGLIPSTDPRFFETLTGVRNGTLDEGGVKAELLGGRISFTAAYFRMTRVDQVFNIVRISPDGSIFNENFLSSGELIRGVEVDAFGKITPRCDFVLSYAQTKGTSSTPTGTLQIPSLPRNSFGGFLTYRFYDEGENGFNIFAGFKRIGRMWGTADNLFSLPSQHKSDFGVGYTAGKVQFKLQATNVFDDYFIEAASAATVVAWTSPRAIYASVSYQFK